MAMVDVAFAATEQMKSTLLHLIEIYSLPKIGLTMLLTLDDTTYQSALASATTTTSSFSGSCGSML